MPMRGGRTEHGPADKLEAIDQKLRKSARNAEMRLGAAPSHLFEPASKTNREVTPSEPQRQLRVSEVVPVDYESGAAQPRHQPGDV
jgi:hypothetical protein